MKFGMHCRLYLDLTQIGKFLQGTHARGAAGESKLLINIYRQLYRKMIDIVLLRMREILFTKHQPLQALNLS